MTSQENDETPLTLETLMSTMWDMMRMITQHREELSKQSERHKNNVSSPPSQSEASSKAMGETTIQKLSKFKKFAPRAFKEAATPNEAEEWLEELKAALEVLR